MHLGEISFCDRVGFNIKSDEIKAKILAEIEAICGFKVIQKHHEKFNSTSSSNKINNMPHVISLRTNGNPYLLYLTKYNYEKQCIFIDKKIQHGYFYPRMILSKLWFHPDLFDNTLIDGEMVKTQTGEWHFIINDIICKNNQVLDKFDITKRISIVYDVLQKQYSNDEFCCCQMFVKRYFKVTELDEMINTFMPKLPYTCRGIYFKPFYLKFMDILFNFDDSLIHKVVRFKYKHIDGETFKATSIDVDPTASLSNNNDAPIESNKPTASITQSSNIIREPSTPLSIFYVKKTSNIDIYELYVGSNDVKVHSCALVNSMKVSKMLKELFRNLNVTDRLKMQCEYNEKFQKYSPLMPVTTD